MVRHKIAIIGSGIAGMSCATYLSNANFDVCIIGDYAESSLMDAYRVTNFPGQYGKSGAEIVENVYAGIDNMKVPCYPFKAVDLCMDEHCDYDITLETGDVVKATYVVIATGVSPAVPEYAYQYQGTYVHTCGICDGALYKNKTVVVVGSGNSALSTALYLSDIASKVILLHRRMKFTAGIVNMEELLAHKNIASVQGEIVSMQEQSEKYMCLSLEDGHKINCHGVFFCIGGIPNTDFLKNIDEGENELINRDGYVKAYHNKTCLLNMYACGDVDNRNAYKQAIVAAAEGCRTAMRIMVDIRSNQGAS